MQPQRFLQSYTCNCFQPDNFCNCTKKKISSDVLMENITNTAESLIEIMHLCGIKEVKVKTMLDVITYYFLHFEEILHRIDSVPTKRFNKEDLMHDLGRKCGMTRRESQMAFSIIKRAFKAFYHGTGQGGVPNRFKDKLTHSSECLWVHAAQRTAEVCACYEGMFYATQKDLECKIKLVYKELYDRIMERALGYNDSDHECMCKMCTKRIRRETLNPKFSTCDFHAKSDPYEVLFLQEQEKLIKEEIIDNGHDKSTIMKEKFSCSCPSLSMSEKDYMYRKVAESIQVDTCQGPFECRWFSATKEEFEADDNDTNIKLPEEFPCQPNEEYDYKCEYAYETDSVSDIECDAELGTEEEV